MQIAKFAWYNVLRNRRRSAFTILITAVATAVLLVGGGFCLYMYQGLEEESTRNTGHLILTKPGYFETQEDYPLEYGMSGYEELKKKYIREDDVKSVLPQIDYQGLISNGNKTMIFMGKGVEKGEFFVKGPFITFTEGKPLADKDNYGEDPEILLAVGLAKNLKMGPGDIVTLLSTTTENVMNAMDFKIKGIFTTGTPELDKHMLYTNLNTTQTLLDSNLVSTLAIHLFDTDKTRSKIAEIQAEHQDLEVTPWWIRAFYYRDVKNLFDRIFGLLGVIISVMVFLAISNTMSMVVMERTREIGTLAAMGTYRIEIVRNFIIEGLIIGIIGTILGVIITLALYVFLNVVDIQMPPPPGSTVGFPIAINLSYTLTLISITLLITICSLVGYLSSRKGAKKPIVEALTYV